MPYGWHINYQKPHYDVLKKELQKFGKHKQIESALKSINHYQSVHNERKASEVESGANVMPVALRYKNPMYHDFKGNSYRDQTYSDLMDEAKRKGHDALILKNTFDPGGSGTPKMVDVGVMFHPNQVRSKFAAFDPTRTHESDLLAAKGGEVLPHHQREANKAKFLEPSKIKDVLYHGSKEPNIVEFKTRKQIADENYPDDPSNDYRDERNAIFLSPDPKFTRHFSVEGYTDTGQAPTTYPVHVQARNPFDFDKPKHRENLWKTYHDIYYNPESDLYAHGPHDTASEKTLAETRMKKRIHESHKDENNWPLFENPNVQQAIQDMGHDSFYIRERGTKNLGVYDPRKIKSAIGNRGTYDTTNPDITKSKGGEVNEMMSQFMPPPDNEPFDPIETAKRNLQGAWDIVKQVPSNVANLASNPIEYTKNLPKPSIEQMAMMLQPSTLVGKIGMPKPKTTMLPKSEYDANLANYMAESKAPKLYHGTNKDITEFDKNKLKRIGWGEGFHMAEDPSMASQYAGTGSGANVMPVHASIKNPLVLNSPHDWWDIIPGETNQTKTAWAKSQGYDGIKYPHSQPNQNETGMAWVAFEPTQIKSAIGNRGTFDSNFADINKAKGGSVPSEPGSTPIKEGHVRLYHQTDGDNLREIEKHGLLLKHAKGIEGPRAIYAGETPFYGDATKKPTLEFQVPKEHWDAPFVLRDVHPQDFISAHYPWHRHARYLEDESGIKNVLSGKFDTLKGDEGKAVEYIKNKYSTKKAKGGNVMPKYPSIEEMLQKLQESGRTPIMPAPDRWFKKPEQHPFQQKAIEKLLAYTGHNREAFPHGAHINPLTGEPLDFEIMHDLGVAIDPMTGTPRMSGIKSGLTEIDPKLGSLTKSNLIRKGLFKHEGGDPLLDRIKFLATIEKSGKGHHYGLSTHYESPAELVQEMRGNPTLRPHSRGDIYGVGDEIGRISIKGMHHPVFEKLVVAPSGMNVQGKKLHKAKGGKVTHAHHLEIEERPL